LQERMKPTWQAIAEKLTAQQPEPEIECPDFDGDEDTNALFDSTRDYVDQIDNYKIYQDRPTERRARRRRTPPPAPPRQPMRRGNEPPPQPRPRFVRGN
jgi:hypothetical protein